MASLYIKSSLQHFLAHCRPVPIATVSFSSLWPHLQRSPHSTAYLRRHHYWLCRHPAFPAYFMSRFIYLLFRDCDAPGSSLSSPMHSAKQFSHEASASCTSCKARHFFYTLISTIIGRRDSVICTVKHTIYWTALKHLPIPKGGGEQILVQKVLHSKNRVGYWRRTFSDFEMDLVLLLIFILLFSE